MEHVDVIIVGAGLSGVGGACHLKMTCPEKSFVIFEGRDAIGGTWDLFRYPGVRSDSDMFTLGYRFRPWRESKVMAEGTEILNYIRDTATEFQVDKAIRYNHRVRRASWSSDDARWTVDVEIGRETKAENGRENGAGPNRKMVQFTCNFLYLCTGYYDYERGYTPEWPGVERFAGSIVHPQKWPEGLDYTNKRVVVIGSGATAVTLVPAMAERATHVTMLQRSPSYIVSRPAIDRVASWLRRCLPDKTAYAASRWKNVLNAMFFYNLARKRPEFFKWMVARGVRKHLQTEYDARHFTPRYNPWDQRMCFVPDADLFNAMRDGRVSVVTDQIETFTENGLLLKSGQHLEADIIVTATGLNMKLFSGMQLVVDDKPVDLPKTLVYKGMMFSDVPNLAFAVGYTNASWTLKCDLTAEYVCRLVNHMDQDGYNVCTPRVNDPNIEDEPVIDFNSGYILRALPTLPRQGSKTPWRLHQNYVKDLSMMRHGRLDDGTMEFGRGSTQRNTEPYIIN
ncbi:MAG TPA: NAD(P)/FAD-dependent oxidoreductase [Pyrinomonadaceae bacterium]|nr:NAD(P)/FAD-dependent oxidoreductase [Pyrinomonadaceae bacterium]